MAQKKDDNPDSSNSNIDLTKTSPDAPNDADFTDFITENVAQSAASYPKHTKPPPPPPRKNINPSQKRKTSNPPPPRKSSNSSKKLAPPPPSQNDNAIKHDNKIDDDNQDTDVDIEAEDDDEKKNDSNAPKLTKSTSITSSALNLFSSATAAVSRGAKSMSNKSSERLSLEGQLRQARISLERFVNPKIINKEINSDKYIPKWVLKGAKGIVFLTVVKAGFLLAGSVGTGIVIVKTKNGSWSGPSSIGVAGISAGVLVGASKVDYIMILPNDNAVKQFTGQGQLRLGGELQLALGPLGRDASGSVGTGDKGFSVIYSYSHAAGLYGGLGMDGKIISVRPKCNKEFYGDKVSVATILEGGIDPKTIKNNDFELICHLLDAYCNDEQKNDEEEKKQAAVKKGSIFGIDPLKLENSKLSKYDSAIPNVLIILKKELFKYEGHLKEGIFRIAPKNSVCKKYKELVDDKEIDIDDINFEEIDGSIIANLIKIFYRELPISIFENINPDKIESCETVSDAQNIIDNDISEPYLSYYYWLLDLVIEVASYNDINFMSANNLAVVIAPNLLDLAKLKNPMKSLTISSSLVTFFSLCVQLRTDQKHLDEATKLLNNEVSNVSDMDVSTPKKPEIPL